MGANQGWQGWQGWLRTQGWHGLQGWSPGDADVDGDGTLVDGLIRNRESLLASPKSVPKNRARIRVKRAKPRSAPPATKAADGLAPIDLAAQMARWSADVRAKVCIADLLGSLKFEPAKSGHGAEVWLRDDTKKKNYLVSRITRPSEAVFRAQAGAVEAWAVRRAERASEILSQVGPQMAYWSAAVNLSPDRTRNTLELCNLAMTFASFVVQRVKQMLGTPRPIEFSATLQPMIPTPPFSALPSGHATEAFMMARLLQRLLGFNADSDEDRLLQRQADRIATNRVVAGLHYPVDSIAGRMLGETLAELFEHLCGGGDWMPRSFNGAAIAKFKDFGSGLQFQYAEPMDTGTAGGIPLAPYFAANTAGYAAYGAVDPLLSWMWQRALAEFA